MIDTFGAVALTGTFVPIFGAAGVERSVQPFG